jgi:cytochrome c-type biogenesis protein CcsB
MDLVSLQALLGNLSFAVLFGALLVYWVNLAFPNFNYLNTVGTILIAIANLAIAALLGSRWLEAGYFPISNLYESLFFLAWGITLVHLFAERMTRSRLVGVFTSPILLGISAFATLTLPADMQISEPLVPALKSNWLMMHVSVMMLSYAALLVGSLVAIAFLLVTWGQKVELRGSSVGSGSYRLGQRNSDDTLTLEKLTLADTLDNISYRIIGLGFPLLTIGIIAGAVWANEAWGSYWSWDPKETWALITWLVYAAYLHSRISRGWQGRKPALLASAGFLVVWVCYLGVNLLGKGLHSYGWFL